MAYETIRYEVADSGVATITLDQPDDRNALSDQLPPSARNLAHMAENVPEGSHRGVIGISRRQWLLVAASLTLGGSVRVGLEDNFYLPDGAMARSNGDLVAKARQMTEDVGRRPATVAQARELLGVPRRAAA